jgi:hypothetical protein
MRILFHPANAIHVFMMEELRRYCAGSGLPIDLFGFELDEWYRLGAVDSLQAASIDFTGFPRTVGFEGSAWGSGGYKALQASYHEFAQTFHQAILRYRPDVFALFGDEGLYEAGMLLICKDLQVPSVFIPEGFVNTEDRLRPASWIFGATNFVVTSVKHRLNALLGKWKQKTVGCQPKGHDNEGLSVGQLPLAGVGLPVIRDFGLNGADMIAAINEGDVAWFIERGVPPDRLVVTGHLLMDRVWRLAQALKEMSHQPLTRASEVAPPHLLVISSGYGHFGFPEQHRWFTEAIRVAAEELGPARLRLSLRLKPGESIEDWRNLWNGVERTINVLPAGGDLYSQIASADMVAALNSQALVEAVMLGKPVVNLFPQGLVDLFALVDRGVAYRARSGQELAKLLQDPRSCRLTKKVTNKRDKYFEEFFYRFDGRAAERISTLLYKMSQKTWQLSGNNHGTTISRIGSDTEAARRK